MGNIPPPDYTGDNTGNVSNPESARFDPIIRPYMVDRDSNVFVGIDYPFHKADGAPGWFASVQTTLLAVKNNLRMLLQTERGERLMQPDLGLGLKQFLFQPLTEDLKANVASEIQQMIDVWLPFVEIRELHVNSGSGNQSNSLLIKVIFNITRDPNTLESVEVEIGE
jgi:hypothetical protein